MSDSFKFDDDTNCVFQILKKENDISSKRILELAASDEFKAICAGCVSGDAFLRSIKKLEKSGYVVSSLSKGGYHWKLIKFNK